MQRARSRTYDEANRSANPEATMSTGSDGRSDPADPTSINPGDAREPLHVVPSAAPLDDPSAPDVPPGRPAGGESDSDPDECTADLDSVVRFVGHDMGADGAMLAVYDGRPGEPHIYSSWGLALGLKVLDGVAGGGAIGHALARGKAIARRLAPESSGNGTRIAEALAAPVRAPSGLTAALCAGFMHPLETARDRKLKRLESYAALIGLWLDDSETLVRLLRAAREDGLTGCITYPTLANQLGTEIKRSQRTGQPLSCLFIDIDDFKKVNDRAGHPAGDAVLAAVGATLRQRVRATDSVGRFGGDEFVVLLPDTGTLAAGQVGEVLSDAVREASTGLHGGPVAISVGVSELAAGMTHTELLEHADRSLRDRRRHR
jgi:diguanylate cyclase (GGDEF)-like protein